MTDAPKLNLHQRLAAVQGELDYIQKEKKGGMSYSIVSHDKVTAAVRPLTVKHGILYYPSTLDVVQDGNRTQVKMDVVFVNVDDPKDFITVATLGYGIDAQDKGPGKAISYCVKYALLKTFGLETGDDPDLDQDAKHEPSKPNGVKTMTKAEANPEFKRIEGDLRVIRDTGTLEDLKLYWHNNQITLTLMPNDWLTKLTDEKEDVKAKLTARAA